MLEDGQSLPGLQPVSELFRARDVEPFRRREQRHLDRSRIEFRRGQRWKAWIAERRGDAFSRTSTPSGRTGSSEPIQPRSSPPPDRRGHEGGRRLRERRIARFVAAGRSSRAAIAERAIVNSAAEI
jgi:hypothetical protein